MTRRTPFSSGVVLSGLVALGWLIGPGCGGGSPKSDGGAGAGGHAGSGAGAGGHAAAGGGHGGAGGAGGGSAGASAAGAGGNGGAAGSAGGSGGAAGGSAGTVGTAGAGGNGGGAAGSGGAGGAGGNGGTGPCTASFGAGSKILYTFDKQTADGGTVDGATVDGGSLAGWAPNGTADSFSWTASTGHACPGALQLVVPGTTSATADFTDLLRGANWTGFSKLHMWVKVQTTNYAVGSTLYLYVQANAFADQAADYRPLARSAFTDGKFHEMVVDLTTLSAQDLTDVDKIDLAVGLPDATDAGTLTPFTVSIDDVWLEAAPPGDATAGN